jgi:hypothetical protein
MRVRSTVIIGGVFGAAALTAAFVISQLPREGEVEDLPPAPAPTAPAASSPPVEPPMTAADGTAELRVTAGGEPIAGASVSLYLALPAAAGEELPRWRKAGVAPTGKDGVARLAARTGLYLAAARAAGLAPGHAILIRAAGESTTRAEVTLAAPATLEGIARPAGERAAAVRVQVSPLAPGLPGGGLPSAPPEETAIAETDAAGQFRLAGLAPGFWALTAEAPGYHPVLLPRVAVPRGAPLAIRIEPLGTISGEVRRADGLPAAGAEVLAASSDHSGRAVTAADGRFTLAVPAGQYRVVAQSGAEAGALAAAVAVAPGAPARGTDVRLGPSASLAVTVTLPGGGPAAGAEVTVAAHETAALLARAIAGADGRVRLSGLPPAPVDVRAELEATTPARAPAVTLQAGAAFPLRLALAAPGTIEGTVRDGAGQPLAGLRVRVIARGDGLAGRLPLETRTDFDGEWRLTGLEAGRAEVSTAGAGADLGVSRAVNVPAGAGARLDLVLPPTGVLTGRAAGEGGPPPLGTVVVATPLRTGPGSRAVARAIADAHGNYRLALPAGEYRVHAAAAEADATDLRVTPGFARVEAGRTSRLDVPTAAAVAADGIEIAVVEPGGAPSPGAVVTLGRPDDPKVAMAQTAGEDGRVRLAREMGLAGRPVTIRAHAGGRSGAWTGPLPAAGTVTVTLAPGAALQGFVRARGARVSGFTLEVSSQPTPEGWRTLDVHRFAGDRFELADLPAEPLRLLVRADDGRRGVAEVRLAAGARQDLDIPIDPARPGR